MDLQFVFIFRENRHKLFEIISAWYVVESADRYPWQRLLLICDYISSLKWFKRKWCHSEVIQKTTTGLLLTLTLFGFVIHLTFL